MSGAFWALSEKKITTWNSDRTEPPWIFLGGGGAHVVKGKTWSAGRDRVQIYGTAYVVAHLELKSFVIWTDFVNQLCHLAQDRCVEHLKHGALQFPTSGAST